MTDDGSSLYDTLENQLPRASIILLQGGLRSHIAMSSPRHSPPPSAAAPRPRGILKNATSSSSNVAGGGAAGSPGTSPGPALASPGMSQDEQAR